MLRRTLIAMLVCACVACSSGESARPAAPAAPPPDPATTGAVSGQVPGLPPGAFIALVPKSPDAVLPQSAQAQMDQDQMTFVPDLLIARTGVPVAFHSSDDELHNINVRNAEQRSPEFNRSIPPGGTFEHTFKQPGFYDVRCDIHPAMSADIFVASTPFASRVGNDGSFAFSGVPPGAYVLTIYSGANTTEKPVEVVKGDNVVRFDGA